MSVDWSIGPKEEGERRMKRWWVEGEEGRRERHGRDGRGRNEDLG